MEKKGRERCRQANKPWRRRRAMDQNNRESVMLAIEDRRNDTIMHHAHYKSTLQFSCKADANSFFSSLFCTHSDRYASKLLGKDKGMFSQAAVSANEMKPNADCIPQPWLREIGHRDAAPGQLFVPSKGMENRCHIKCPGMGAVY